MEEKKEKKEKRAGLRFFQITFGTIIVMVFLLFVIGQVVLPAENLTAIGTCELYSGEWEQVFSDGTREKVKVPWECKAEKGKWIAVETTLPEEMTDISFSIRSMQQDMKIYIGGELRKEYSTVDSQLFGKTSTISYVFFEGNEEDAGKTLRIELMSDSSYAGYVSELYMGSRISLWQHFILLYAPAVIIAMFLLILGVGIIIFSILFWIIYRTEMEMKHLGNAIIIASSWMIAESRLRQFILPNSTLAVYLGFYMIMLLPYPLSAYLNKIQKFRYHKVYTGVSVAALVNVVFATTMQVLGIKDFFETMMLSHIILIALIVIIATTITIDIRKKHIKDYKAVAVGFLMLMISGIGEIGMVYVNSSQYNGICLCIGLVILTLAAGVKTWHDFQRVEKERKMALAVSESKTQFLANISHEIRTPINTIVGMNEMILRENDDESTREYAFNIKNASDMLLGLINDVLDLSKIEAGKLQIVESNYSLVETLKAVILGTQVRLQQKELEFKIEVDENMPAVLRGDEIRIRQIMNNFLSNAVKYTDKGSVTFRVKGRTENDEFFLHMEVEDTGIGIDDEDMDKLFDSFLRFDLKQNRNVEGTGLGLSITKQLVENMGGKIAVTSKKGEGSCFMATIPQGVIDDTPMGALDSKETTEKMEKERQEEEENALHAPDAKLLIVDDNEMNLIVIEALLKRTEVQMDFARGGMESLEMMRKKKYDLVLMDHMMPKPDGMETLKMLRKEKENPNYETPVVVLTANAVGDVAEKYMEAGFADYLSKPVEIDKLEHTISKYI